MAAPAPVPSPIGIFPQFLAQQPETLLLQEKIFSLTGSDFLIKLANGTPILRVEAKGMSFSGRKKMFDLQGTHLFDIVKEKFHLHTTFAVEDTKGVKIMEVKNSIKMIGSKATATFTSTQTGKAESLTMKGKWADSSADIIDEAQGNLVVAHIDRKMAPFSVKFNKQQYGVTVAPGVDMALVAALCICLDEKHNEKSTNVALLGSIS